MKEVITILAILATFTVIVASVFLKITWDDDRERYGKD